MCLVLECDLIVARGKEEEEEGREGEREKECVSVCLFVCVRVCAWVRVAPGETGYAATACAATAYAAV